MNRTARTSLLRHVTLAVLVVVTSILFFSAPAQAAHTEDRLEPGESLTAGQYIRSPDGSYKLTMQHDGNLVLRRTWNNSVVWHASTDRNPGATVRMQYDGNLVIRAQNGRLLYNPKSHDDDYDGEPMRLNNLGSLGWRYLSFCSGPCVGAIVEGDQLSPALGARTTPGVLKAGDKLLPGESIKATEDNGLSTVLTMQRDGNLVLRQSWNNSVIWHAGTDRNPGAKAVMQYDGNFVVYAANGRPLWNARTNGNPGAELRVYDRILRIDTSKGQGLVLLGAGW